MAIVGRFSGQTLTRSLGDGRICKWMRLKIQTNANNFIHLQRS
jgi:hypothetical protein